MITIKKFLDAWNKFPPTKIEKFYFKHFSKEAKNRKVSWIVFSLLLIPFLIGYIGTIVDTSYSVIKVATLTLSFMLVIFAIPWIYVWYAHKRRIKKIIKELNCTTEEYDNAVDLWGHLIK